jgi:hypoxanthine phosphoribosyltransferase
MADKRIEVLISEQDLDKRVTELAAQIEKDYKGKTVTAVCILTGAVIFMVDLLKKLDLDVEMDFMSISSYGSGTESSGIVRIDKDLEEPLTGKHVLLVEDIIDSGRTLSRLKKHLFGQKPETFCICTLLDKPSRRVVFDVKPDYTGFEIDDKFVVGYGLDYNQKYRNLPFVGVLPPELL